MTRERIARVHAVARGQKGLDEETYRLRLRAVGVESGKAQPEGQDFPPLPEVWMVDWIASKTGEHYQEFHDSEAGAFLTAAQLAAATPAMPARITQLNPDPVRDALVEALRKCKTCALPTEVRELVNAALRAAGVVLT